MLTVFCGGGFIAVGVALIVKEIMRKDDNK